MGETKPESRVEPEAIEQGPAAELLARHEARRLGSAATSNEDAMAGLSIGDQVTVTKGKETFFPVKFNGFDVGPLSVTTTIREGEDAGEAYGRARAALEVLFQVEYELTAKDYFVRLEDAERRAKSSPATRK